MFLRGGGCISVDVKLLPPGMACVEFVIDCKDAMGANIVNTVMEGVATFIQKLTGCRIGARILSNLCDKRLARARCEIPYRAFAVDDCHDNGRVVAQKIVETYEFARRDSYRACTHNKGILNAADAILIATGNDWRALEAGAHAYACRSGRYEPLSQFRLDDEKQKLLCEIELPIAVGVVGGNLKKHPGVEKNLRILGNFAKSSQRLSAVVASVALAENLASLRALACEGIQSGHMALHHRKNA